MNDLKNTAEKTQDITGKIPDESFSRMRIKKNR
ncbi:uncharacterized protein METZ01_LOCUS279737 [marine metagenome]|uniref:Uncharacterized protein n=1 Tax=marine metagenome TaxID=408172 RepID=A0A382KTM5_9ZZZZ